MQYYIRKIFNEDQLETIKKYLENVNQDHFWVNGANSLTRIDSTAYQMKSNSELIDENALSLINGMIMESLDRDKEFINFTVPEKTYLNIVSRMKEGDYYDTHSDNWDNGNYSTTVFLNDPQEYEGGELCLYYGGDDEIKIKLDAGYAVTYSTGTFHRVNKVKSGTRYVSVFWTTSLIKDPFIRYVYTQISNVSDIISTYNLPTKILNCSSATKDPNFCLASLRYEILRRYNNVI